MKKKRFFNAKSFMGMHRVSVKDLLKNASWPMHMTQQGVKNVKKKFHNRLAALRTASKVEIEAADNIF